MPRTVRFDPHVHTRASSDSSANVEALLAAARSAGIHAIAITDHDTMRGARRAVRISSSADPVVVPGVEVSSAVGHVLGLGVARAPPPGLSLRETVERIRDRGGIAVIPHPFQRSRHGVGRSSIVDCDGIEVHNAMAMTGLQNRRAELFARRAGLPMLGGSDAHHPSSVGLAYTEVSLPEKVTTPTAEDIVAGIEAGETAVVGGRTSVRRYLETFVRNAHQHALDRLAAVRGGVSR